MMQFKKLKKQLHSQLHVKNNSLLSVLFSLFTYLEFKR